MNSISIQKSTYYNSSRFVIKPNKHTRFHHHHDVETLIVISGKGKIRTDGYEKDLQQGSVINLSPLETHIIFNVSQNDDLIINNFWWSDNEYFKSSLNKKLSCDKEQNDPNEINLILPSFTTPNGNLHLGHIAGPLLAADILKRICINNGINAYLLSGTIGHQTQVQVTADKIGKTYLETALLYSNNIKTSLNHINIKTDCFVTLESKADLLDISNLFVKRLFEKNLIKFKEDEVYYCNDCDKFLFEANIIGSCPHCNHKVNAECEYCYEYFHESELQNPLCLICNKSPELKKLGRYYFSLNSFRQVIENLYFQQKYTGLSKPFVEKILKKTLPDIPMSIIAEQGIPFMSNNHVLYSAVELIPRFLVATRIALNNCANISHWEDYFISKKTNLYLLFGVDNLYLRCIIFPILLHTFNDKLINTINFMTNEFYRLNNSKFSTSRKHVISVEDMQENNLEYLRYYLAMTRPEVFATSFNRDDFNLWVEKGNLKKYLNMIDNFNSELGVKFNHQVPEAGDWDNFLYFYQHFLNFAIPLILSAKRIDSFNLKNYIVLLNMIIDFTVKFFEEGILINLTLSCSRTFFALSAKGILTISILLSPICPIISKNIQDIFYKNNILPLKCEHLNQWV
ncbi:MAG: class I tRNA ligase family protein [Gammaproteobacteria bacterium]|nr:class I tRNA ligase family protein [Gammaproteobacteria bacterium]